MFVSKQYYNKKKKEETQGPNDGKHRLGAVKRALYGKCWCCRLPSYVE